MLEAIPKLGLSGGVGALIGMIAVWWVEPTTSEGATLLLAVTIISSGVIGGIVSYLLGSKKETVVGTEQSPAPSKRVGAVRAGVRKRPRSPKP